MSPSYWNLLKRHMQSYTVEWRRDKQDPDLIYMVGDWQWRDHQASENQWRIVKELFGITWPS